MTHDRYLRVVFTIIAAALVYLCAALTPLPVLSAQRTAPTPGAPTGPAEVFIVGWTPGLPAIPVQVGTPVQVTGTVRTEQGANETTRMVLVGWEERATEGARGAMRPFDAAQTGLPVTTAPVKAP